MVLLRKTEYLLKICPFFIFFYLDILVLLMACQVKNQYAVCKISGDTTCSISDWHQSSGNDRVGSLKSYIPINTENCALAFCVVWFW